ncbi:MAG TPA: nuclear transport factor 2 family protein [Pyrinomonadaceae bacterium]|nr:nuclear transport factor 2 family protein [Pyrinomonadaceae bacterium]
MKIVVLLLLLFSAVPAFAQSAKEVSKIKTDITAVMDEQTAAWNRGDVEGFMRGYWNSKDLVFVSGDGVTYGWQPTLDRYRKNYNSKEKMGTLKFSGLQIDVISKNAAVVLGSWALTRANDNPKGKFTLIFRKFGDVWRIVHDHTS